MYLSRANLIPCVEAHCRHRLCAVSRAVQFSAVDSLYASRLMSSTKPIADSCCSGRFSASSSGVLFVLTLNKSLATRAKEARNNKRYKNK